MKQRGVSKHRSMQDWLRSKAPGAGGGGGKFLSGKWKEKGEVDTFLHTKCLPMAVWQHPFATLVPVKKDGAETVHVWTKKYTCHETEDVLEQMYFREEKGEPSSARKKPPERCGMCKLIEWVWLQCWAWLDSHEWKGDGWVETKKGKGRGVDPCARMFRFTSEADDRENVTIHAGGFCGLFGRKELPDDLVAAMKHAKISPKDAWKVSSVVKPQSVLCVVNADAPADGVQISVETKELGEKVKEEITRVYKSLEVDVQRQPFCIRWEYDKSAQMGKMYKATAMMKIKPSPRVLELLRGPAPNLSQLETPFNQQLLRSTMERHCLLEKGTVPWSTLFPTKEQEKAWQEEDEADAAGDHGDTLDDADRIDADRVVDDRDSDVEGDNPADDEDDEDDDEQVACDDCGKPMAMTDAACPHCGKKYDVEEDPEPEPEPKTKIRSRADALAAKSKSKGGDAGKSKPKPAPEREPGDDSDLDDNQGDEIPF